MIDDLTERGWWMFRLPEATAHVPANDEEQARRQLAASSYTGAPVATWPCIGSRWTSRRALVDSLLRSTPR